MEVTNFVLLVLAEAKQSCSVPAKREAKTARTLQSNELQHVLLADASKIRSSLHFDMAHAS